MSTQECAESAATADTAPARAIERWLPVVGWEGWYSVSDRGRVRSEDRVVQRSGGLARFVQGQLLEPFPYSGKPGRRYLCVHLWRDGVRETRPVHQLVLEAFVGPRPDGTLGCHFDDDRNNNFLGNLRWDSPLANAVDRTRNARLRRALAIFATW